MKTTKVKKLSGLPNIGPVVEQQLNQVGIKTYEDLKSIGAESAWLKIYAIDDSACINRLLGIEGAIQGIKKSKLSAGRQGELRAFVKDAKV